MLIDSFPNDFKIIRDSVHGYIRIPGCYVREIVDTELFQRLRHIEQTSMRPLFPASRHDRFIHSLGVYHLGCRAFESLYRNAISDGTCEKTDRFDESWWLKHYVLFTLACLLHDCAHAAFSHTYENYYILQKPPGNAKDDAGAKSRLDFEMSMEYVSDQGFRQDFYGLNESGSGTPHERMSALMVRRYFKDGIERVFECISSFRTSKNQSPINLEDADFALIARMITGCQYQSCMDSDSELCNCFISLLNSNTVDVDGLDYMIRDTYNSGITNRSVDCDRLLGSLRLCKAVRFHKAEVQDLSAEGVWLPKSTITLSSCHGEDAYARFCGDLNCRFYDKDDWKHFLREKRENTEENQFTYRTSGDTELVTLAEMRSECEIRTNKLCRSRMRHWSGMLDGVLCTASSRLDSLVAKPDCTLTYVLAYGKSSLSVLQSAVDARNTFYQWVYTHPQVVYHSNFLQNYLLKMSAKYLCCLQRRADTVQQHVGKSSELERNMPPRSCLKDCPLRQKQDADANNCTAVGEEDAIARILGIEGFFNPNDEDMRSVSTEWLGHSFYRSSDDDLNALFKWVYLQNKRRGDDRNQDIEEFFGEYFSRPHHHAIWKSFGDLEVLKRKHQNVSIPEYSDLPGTGQSMSSKNYVFVTEGNSNELLRLTKGQCDLIAIEARAKLKSLDYAGILVIYDEEAERLVDVLASSTSFTDPEPLMFVFETKS